MAQDIEITTEGIAFTITTPTRDAEKWVQQRAHRYGVFQDREPFALYLFSHVNADDARADFLAFNDHGGKLQGWTNDVDVEWDINVAVDERGVCLIGASCDDSSVRGLITFADLLVGLGVKPETALQATHQVMMDIQRKKEANG